MMREDFEKWQDQWDKAIEDNIFQDAPKPPVPSSEVGASDFFGNYRPGDETSLNDVDGEYWDRVYKLSNQQHNFSPDPLDDVQDEILTEDVPTVDASKPQNKPLRDLPGKEPLSVKGAELSNTANPIYPPTRGEDQRNRVTPDWSTGPQLSELVNMKYNLYELEVKLNANPNFGAMTGDTDAVKKIQDQINDLKMRLNHLSNSLSPDFMQQELS